MTLVMIGSENTMKKRTKYLNNI